MILRNRWIKVLVLGITLWVIPHAVFADAVYSQSFSNSAVVGETNFQPTGNGSITHFRFYVPYSATTTPYVEAVYLSSTAGSAFSGIADTFYYSDFCTEGSDTNGIYYDCNYTGQNAGVGDVVNSVTDYSEYGYPSNYLNVDLCGVFNAGGSCSALNTYSAGVDSGNGHYWVGYIDGTAVSNGCVGGGTCIASVQPYYGNGEYATGTPIELNATGYVSDTDAQVNDQIEWRIWPLANQCVSVLNYSSVQTCQVNVNTGSYVGGQTFFSGGFLGDPVLASLQNFDVSSTAPATDVVGVYQMVTSIVQPTSYFGVSSLFGIGFGYNTIVSTTTQFVIGTTTVLDQILQNAALLEQNATSTSAVAAACSPLSGQFDIDNCTAYLLTPDFSSFSTTFVALRQGFLSMVPWGYITRFIVIASGNATSSLPSLVLNFGSAPLGISSIASNATLDLTPWNGLLGTSSYLGTATSTVTGKTIRQIVEPGWDIFIILIFVMLIVSDILKINRKIK